MSITTLQFRKWILVAALVCSFTVIPGQALAAPRDRGPTTDISACATITEPGSYTVTQDLNANGTCIAIQADGVSINLANHSITGSGVGSGVSDQGGSYTSISVFDGTITGFQTAIDLGASSASIVRNVRATDNLLDGIVVGASSFLLQNIAVRNNRGIVYECPSNAIANSAWGNSSEDLLEINPNDCTLSEGHNSYGSSGGSGCQPGSCPSGLTDCSGACADLSTDESNCGSCGFSCASGERCLSGSCALSCQTGLTNCGGVCRDLLTDANNCGGCGAACATGQSCIAGSCEGP